MLYQKVPLDKIPWNSETPQDSLVELVQNGKYVPARPLISVAAPATCYIPGRSGI